jgi:hypothetical protein
VFKIKLQLKKFNEIFVLNFFSKKLIKKKKKKKDLVFLFKIFVFSLKLKIKLKKDSLELVNVFAKE